MSNFFQITRLPVRAKLELNGSPIVLNSFYDLNEAGNVYVKNDTGIKGEPFDSFTYKIKEDDVISKNTGTVTVNFETVKIGTPLIVDLEKTIYTAESFLFDSVVLPQDKFDRIKIKSIVGNGVWEYNNTPIIPGTTYMFYDLIGKLKFIANEVLVKDNYSVLEYETANLALTHNQINRIVVNTKSDGAEIYLIEYFLTIDETQDIHNYKISIIKAYPDSTYKIELNPTLFPALGTDVGTKIELIKNNNQLLLLDTNTVVSYTGTMNNEGTESFDLKITSSIPKAVDQSIVFKLLEVNDSETNVNQTLNILNLTIPKKE